jgi:hypothetical protein
MVIAACRASGPATTPFAEPATVPAAAVKPIETATLPLPPIIGAPPLPSATPWPPSIPDRTLTAPVFDGAATAQHTPNYVTGCDVTLPPPTLLDTAAAIQHFETGLMIWLQARHEIWVLIASPTARTAQFYWRVLPDQWSAGLAESDPGLTPPPDRVQPVRGFGYAWRIGSGSMAAQRADLGWAIDEELGFTTTLIYYPQGFYSPDCIWQPKSGIYELRDDEGSVFRFVGAGGIAYRMGAQP